MDGGFAGQAEDLLRHGVEHPADAADDEHEPLIAGEILVPGVLVAFDMKLLLFRKRGGGNRAPRLVPVYDRIHRMKMALWLFGAALTALASGKDKLPDSRADLLRGQKLFQAQCALCHGPKGEGGRGPALTRAKLSRAPDDAALIQILTDGIRGTEMQGAGAMSEREVRQTAAYVRSLGKVALKPVPGDAMRGSGIYAGKGNCAGCHSIHGEGGVAGPDLSAIGESRSAAYLRESLVNPGQPCPRATCW